MISRRLRAQEAERCRGDSDGRLYACADLEASLAVRGGKWRRLRLWRRCELAWF